ncbi:MAG: hypothetical protein KDB27_15050 [Planctomycetales bacterium]|nr:hypothetical protein [Planctomycetales bacterium]
MSRRFAMVVRCAGCLLVAAAGGFTVCVALTRPTPIASRRISDKVFRTSPHDITSIEIRPYGDPLDSAYPQLLTAPLIIRDSSKMATIQNAISSATTFSPNHPDLLWACVLIVRIGSDKHICEVRGTSNAGVLIEVVSSADVSSWRTGYGTYQASKLGPVLKSIAAE